MPNSAAPIYHDDAGFLAANLTPETTGVDGAIVWVFAGEPTRNQGQLGPRILVAPGERLGVGSLVDAVAVQLTSPPTVLGALPLQVEAMAVEFATRNRHLLVEYWRGELATGATLGHLMRI